MCATPTKATVTFFSVWASAETTLDALTAARVVVCRNWRRFRLKFVIAPFYHFTIQDALSLSCFSEGIPNAKLPNANRRPFGAHFSLWRLRQAPKNERD